MKEGERNWRDSSQAQAISCQCSGSRGEGPRVEGGRRETGGRAQSVTNLAELETKRSWYNHSSLLYKYLPVKYLGISWEVPSAPAFHPPLFLNITLEEDCSFTLGSGGEWWVNLLCHCREVPERRSSIFSKRKQNEKCHSYQG